jgi:two-component system sensor histidine kinase TctE
MMSLLFMAGMVALYIAAQSYGRGAADRSFDRLLAGSAISIAETLSATNEGIFVDIPYAALEMLSAAPDDRVFYRVTGPDDRTLTGYGDLPDPPPPQPLAPNETDGFRFFDAQYRGELVRFVTVSREIALSGSAGWVRVQVGQTRRARETVARETVFSALVPIGAMTVLALGLVWFGISGALRPLLELGGELARRDPSDLHPIDTVVPMEVRPLVSSINGFMLRLSGNIDTLKAFIADAAHQLRTPLTAMLAQASAAGGDSPAELRRTLDAIQRNGAKLSHLLNQLLSDATVMYRADVRRFEPVDLVDVVQEAIRESVLLVDTSDIRLKTSLKNAPCVGDRVILVEAIKNLINNSLRHGCGEQGRVDLELASRDAEYCLTVSDRGPGIPVDERERVFERFARGGSETVGAGIGLAIVRQAIVSHRGTIELADRDGGGLSVVVCLPKDEQCRD